MQSPMEPFYPGLREGSGVRSGVGSTRVRTFSGLGTTQLRQPVTSRPSARRPPICLRCTLRRVRPVGISKRGSTGPRGKWTDHNEAMSPTSEAGCRGRPDNYSRDGRAVGGLESRSMNMTSGETRRRGLGDSRPSNIWCLDLQPLTCLYPLSLLFRGVPRGSSIGRANSLASAWGPATIRGATREWSDVRRASGASSSPGAAPACRRDGRRRPSIDDTPTLGP